VTAETIDWWWALPLAAALTITYIIQIKRSKKHDG
jgi:hypothetical protein